MKENYLTTENFETFLKEEIFEKKPQPTDLNLNRWEFFDPFSIIFLLLMARQRAIALNFGDQNPALAYLEQIGFFDIARPVIARSPESIRDDEAISTELTNHSKNSSPRNSTNILLKVTPIESTQDLTGALKHLLSSTAAILKDHLAYTAQDTSLFLGAFTEVAQNILDHSGDRGLAAAQAYTTKKGSRFAAIAVGDLGIGIRSSLSERYPKQFVNDVIAIRRAFDPSISRFQGRGWGLTQVRSITEKYNGKLWVRSGRGLVKFHRQFTSYQTHLFPGTQISIYLEERKPARLHGSQIKRK